MRAYLEIIHGRYAGQTICLEAGDLCRVGRTGEADVYLPDDPFLSPVHFTLACSADQCLVYDLGSDLGLFLNEQKISMGVLKHGDRLLAGITEFDVYLERQAQNGDSEVKTPLRCIRDEFLSENGNLFVLIDAARDQKILSWLESQNLKPTSLYQGEKQEQLAAVAPYLLSAPATRETIDLLLRRLWGRACSVWLFSHQSLELVRRHFRHFLMVEDEQGKEMYFRFYDPRVLRAFLPACNSSEIADFFGNIDSLVMEGRQTHTLLRFSRTESGVNCKETAYRMDNTALTQAVSARVKNELRIGVAA